MKEDSFLILGWIAIFFQVCSFGLKDYNILFNFSFMVLALLSFYFSRRFAKHNIKKEGEK